MATTKATIRAGYTKNPQSAQVIGSRMMKKPHVAAAVEAQTQKKEKDNEQEAARVDAGLWMMADADIRQAFNADGTPKSIHDIPDDVAKAITGVEVNSDGEITKFRFVEKGRIYELLGKRVGAFTDRHEHSTKDGKPLATFIDMSNVTDKVLEKLAGLVDATHR